MKLSLSIVLLLFATSCATDQDALMEDATEYSAVSVTNPTFDPSVGQTFAWYAPIIWSSEAAVYNEAMRQELTTLVENELRSRGYRIIADREQADYVIGAALVDGDSQQSEQIRNFFRLFPAIGPSRANLPATTAMIGIVDHDHIASFEANDTVDNILWRSSIQVFVVGESLSPELQRARLRGLAGRLMRSFP